MEIWKCINIFYFIFSILISDSDGEDCSEYNSSSSGSSIRNMYFINIIIIISIVKMIVK